MLRIRRFRRWLLIALAALVLVLLLGVVGGWLALRASLPSLDGEIPAAGLSAPASIERDALGTVIVRAGNREDAAFALGFAHGQERFFEMDLLRRRAAGELSALFGITALKVDRAARVHRFRNRVHGYLAALPNTHRSLIRRYVEGVNSGLTDLRIRPFPYLILGRPPLPWTEEDSLLAPIAMFFDLQGGSNERELKLERMRAVLAPSVFAFLTAAGTEWDAPLTGASLADPPIPRPEEIDLRGTDLSDPPTEAPASSEGIGSNSFAVAASHSLHGGALLANDMHLGLRVPNIWFRAQLRYPDTHNANRERVVTGVTLPGTPFVAVGSNGQIAWGFTNSYGDWMDFIELRVDARSAERYLTPSGWKNVVVTSEEIEIRGAKTQRLDVRETDFGPVVAQSHAGLPLALMWTAHHAVAVNTGLAEMENAGTIEQAIKVAKSSGIPVQNLLVAAADGRIAWTPMGRIPRRATNFDPRFPSDWSAPGSGWQGWYEGPEVPQVVAPESGRLWTANARVLGGEALQRLGDGGYTIGARARQIRDGLFARERMTETDLYAIQLDDRAIFLDRWHELLLKILKDSKNAELRSLAASMVDWDGYANPKSRAYRQVRDFRLRVHMRFLQLFEAPMREAHSEWAWPSLPQLEGAVWRTLSERPPHLLPRNFSNWEAWLLSAAQDSLRHLEQLELKPANARWGLANTSSIRHPLSRALPGFSWLLDMPAEELAGDQYMPRVQGTNFGASERMVVSPGREQDGILQMPGGQSGHPLSPFYGAGHQDWADGKPTPFLPGPVLHRLELVPGR